MAFLNNYQHLPCLSSDCESSDAMSIDDKHFGKCFSCKRNIPPEMVYTAYPELKEPLAANGDVDSTVTYLPSRTSLTEAPRKPQGLIYHAISDRKITQATCTFYGVGYRGDDLVFPYKTANKIKTPNKEFKIEGNFTANKELFGQGIFAGGQSKILVVEGELDALAAYQMLGGKRPVVSIRSGATSAVKDINENFKYLDTFDEVVFCFDNDEAGLEAQEKCASIFSHKSFIMHHPADRKDACDYLVNNDRETFAQHFYRADKWKPQHVVTGDSLLESVMTPLPSADCTYPYEGLNKLTYGLRQREIVLVTAGSGLGKSQFLREVVYHVLNESNDNIGLMFMEESTRKTGLSLMSIAANKTLHLPNTEATSAEKQAAFDKTLGTGRFYLFDHYGDSNIDTIISTIQYMARVGECKYIFLDHISIIVGQEGDKERTSLDTLMHKLVTVVQQTGICLIAVSHLKRPEGKGHEEGAATSLAQIRGTGAIGHLSDIVLGLERHGQHDDERERNTTRVRVLKNRFSGLTGKACALLYNHNTGRMKEINEEEL